ncbi:MAG: GNVR domain-containing protein, partial [Nitrospira sp.]
MQYSESAASVEQTGMATVHEYMRIASRNKWVIAGAIVFSLTLAIGYLLIAPQYYQSQTLIVVEERTGIDQVINKAERTDEHFERQLFLIQKQIISRDFLGVIAKEFSLRRDGSDEQDGLADGAELAGMTKVERAMIDPAGGKGSGNLVDGFVVSFLDRDPQTARQVTARIADKFIEENNSEREKEIEGTGEFLEEELRLMKRELEKREENISSFKKSHLGNLPQQADANLRALDRAEAEIAATNESLQRQSDKLGNLNQEVHLYRTTGQSNFRSGTTRSMEPDPLLRHLKELREKLVKLRAEFWDGYPEIILTKEEIRQTEEELTNVYGPDALRADKTAPLDPVLQDLLRQQSEARTEIGLLRQRLDQLRTTKTELERRLDRSPAVEQELLVLERDYNNLKNNYAMLLDKRLHTRVEENIGKRQKGGKYRILDRANLPREPVIPNKPRVLVLGLLFGCVVGAGLSVLREHLTPQFRSADDIEFLLAGPRLLAAIPDFSSLWATAGAPGYFQTPALPRPSLGMTMRPRSEIVPSHQPLAERASSYEIDRRFVAKMFPRSMAAEQYRV